MDWNPVNLEKISGKGSAAMLATKSSGGVASAVNLINRLHTDNQVFYKYTKLAILAL